MADAVVGDHRQGPHPWFQWSEFTPGVPLLTPAMRKGLHEVTMRALVPVRRRYGRTTITSGWRSDAHNTRVGGVTNSRHRYHAHPTQPAVDFLCATMDPEDWAGLLEDLLPTSAGIGVYGRHVHVDLRPVRTRWTG